jgi:alpha-ribazole phosphatase
MFVHLLRHGETTMPDRLLGRTDAPLAPAGWVQFERQTERLAVDAIVASSRQRARLPAEALAAARDLPLSVDNDWAEIDFGDWDGRVVKELHADEAVAGSLMAMYQSEQSAGAPGGENWSALQSRVARAIDRLLDGDEGSRVLVSTHAGPMRAALALATGMPFTNLWAMHIGLGARLTLRLGRDSAQGRWGEVIELVQA